MMGKSLPSSSAQQALSVRDEQEVNVISHSAENENLPVAPESLPMQPNAINTNVAAPDADISKGRKSHVFRKSHASFARNKISRLPADAVIESSRRLLESCISPSTPELTPRTGRTSPQTPTSITTGSPPVSPTPSDFMLEGGGSVPDGDWSEAEQSVPELVHALTTTTDMLKVTQKEFLAEKKNVRLKEKNMMKLAKHLSAVVRALEEKDYEIEQLRFRLEKLEQKLQKENEEIGQKQKEVVGRNQILIKDEEKERTLLVEVVSNEKNGELTQERSVSDGMKQHVATSQGKWYIRYAAIGACAVIIPGLTYVCRSQNLDLGKGIDWKEVIKAISGGSSDKGKETKQ